MSNLAAIAYPDEATAKEVAGTLVELQKEHSIEIDDLVVVVCEADGKVKLRQSFHPSATGAAALFVLVRSSTPDKVLPRISQYGGEIIHTSLNEEAENVLREALREGAPA